MLTQNAIVKLEPENHDKNAQQGTIRKGNSQKPTHRAIMIEKLVGHKLCGTQA